MKEYQGMTFPHVAADLDATLDQAIPRLEALTPEQAARRRASGKWSSPEIIGHLVDSAANNHQRFLRAAIDGSVTFPGYPQNEMVAIEQFGSFDWQTLVRLWGSYNRLLAHLLRQIPESASQNPCHIGTNPPCTLSWLAEDYVVHLKHHLEQIF